VAVGAAVEVARAVPVGCAVAIGCAVAVGWRVAVTVGSAVRLGRVVTVGRAVPVGTVVDVVLGVGIDTSSDPAAAPLAALTVSGAVDGESTISRADRVPSLPVWPTAGSTCVPRGVMKLTGALATG
jgi:hypothetical protein